MPPIEDKNERGAKTHNPDGDRGPRFDLSVEPGGYAWWYLDAISDDRNYAMVVVFFCGSAFSPFYALSRTQNRDADPLDHCAVNVVLYKRRSKIWTFTECTKENIERGCETFSVLGNEISWHGDFLSATFDLRSPVCGIPLEGYVRLYPARLFGQAVALDKRKKHFWHPVAPLSRIEVELKKPSISFQGSAYHDANVGLEPLSNGFKMWSWSRAEVRGRAIALYDGMEKDGSKFSLGRIFDPSGENTALGASSKVVLPSTRWLIPRQTRVDRTGSARLIRTLENSPFYARSLIETELEGEKTTCIHETLNLDRFNKKWVQFLFYLRMRRQTAGARDPRFGLLARLWPR
ncbi:MAG: carotenoid 1,2-hydratase [Pseudomonadota bacterium]